jgi:hypothetical protein
MPNIPLISNSIGQGEYLSEPPNPAFAAVCMLSEKTPGPSNDTA